jgi:predicted MFS family arabinose efflux permease
MNVTPYRHALALPGVRSLLLVTLFARIPTAASAVALTLHVVQELDRGYAAAGAVGAAMTIGVAIGSPMLGRLTDRHGLRPVLIVTTVVEAAFWVSAASLPYRYLLPAAFVGGLLQLPVFTVARQSLAALVPEEQRRPAYALDAMAVELSFMLGPALAVLLATSGSAGTAMVAIGGGIVGAGIAVILLDPPIRASHEEATGPSVRLPRRSWLTSRMLSIFAMTSATTVVLGGTDVAVVAAMREAGQVKWTGAVIALWCVYSLIGGFAYGAVRRPMSPLLLLTLLSVLVIPVGLGGGTWWLLGLALIGAGAMTAPALTSTADAVSRLAPPAVRGEATGLHGSALTVGLAIGAPLAGAVMDATSPAWGFTATGGLGLLIVLACLPTELRHRRAAREAATADDAVPGSPQVSPVPVRHS